MTTTDITAAQAAPESQPDALHVAYQVHALAAAVEDAIQAEASGEAPKVGREELLTLTGMLTEQAHDLVLRVADTLAAKGE